MKNMRIWKEVLWDQTASLPPSRQLLSLPSGAKILDVQMRDNKLCLWFLCNTLAPLEPRQIAIYETGLPLPDDPGEYIATFQDDVYVFHVFEVGDE